MQFDSTPFRGIFDITPDITPNTRLYLFDPNIQYLSKVDGRLHRTLHGVLLHCLVGPPRLADLVRGHKYAVVRRTPEHRGRICEHN